MVTGQYKNCPKLAHRTFAGGKKKKSLNASRGRNKSFHTLQCTDRWPRPTGRLKSCQLTTNSKCQSPKIKVRLMVAYLRYISGGSKCTTFLPKQIVLEYCPGRWCLPCRIGQKKIGSDRNQKPVLYKRYSLHPEVKRIHYGEWYIFSKP